MLQKPQEQERSHLLEAPLNPALVQERRGGGNATFEYISGSIIIDQANRVFGYGGWSFEHETPEPFYDLDGKLIAYTCKAKVTVETTTITDEGSTRLAWPREGGNPTIDSHITARKGCITDAKRRCFRNFGSQFGNDLYNDDGFRREVAQNVISRLVAMGYDQRRAHTVVTTGYSGHPEHVPINRSIFVLTQALSAAQAERAKAAAKAAAKGVVDGQASEPITNDPVNDDAPNANTASPDAAPTVPPTPAPEPNDNRAEPVTAATNAAPAQTPARQPQSRPRQQAAPAQNQRAAPDAPAAQRAPVEDPQSNTPAQGRGNPARRTAAAPANRPTPAPQNADQASPNGGGSDYMDTPDEDPFS